jgi:hypothetical protein
VFYVTAFGLVGCILFFCKSSNFKSRNHSEVPKHVLDHFLHFWEFETSNFDGHIVWYDIPEFFWVTSHMGTSGSPCGPRELGSNLVLVGFWTWNSWSWQFDVVGVNYQMPPANSSGLAVCELIEANWLWETSSVRVLGIASIWMVHLLLWVADFSRDVWTFIDRSWTSEERNTSFSHALSGFANG